MKIIKALCFISLAVFLVNAQKPNKSQKRESFIPKIVARSGWTTPAFAENVAEVREGGLEILEDVEVKEKYHILAKEQLISAETCSGQSNAKNERRDYAVRDFTSFEYKGRVFAYEVTYFGVFTENGYITQYAYCLRRAVYADDDGDGKFELRCSAKESGFLPEWVKNSDKTKVDSSFFLKTKTPDEAQKEEPLTEITVARSGWTYPLFANDISYTQNGKDEFIEDVDIQTKVYFLMKEKLVYFESCDAKADEEEIAKNTRRSFIIKGFRTYETRGKVFAYRLSGPMVFAENGQIIERFGAVVNFIYVDEDGDGTFERRCGDIELKSFPQWVKDLGQIKVKTKDSKTKDLK